MSHATTDISIAWTLWTARSTESETGSGKARRRQRHASSPVVGQTGLSIFAPTKGILRRLSGRIDTVDGLLGTTISTPVLSSEGVAYSGLGRF